MSFKPQAEKVLHDFDIVVSYDVKILEVNLMLELSFLQCLFPLKSLLSSSYIALYV